MIVSQRLHFSQIVLVLPLQKVNLFQQLVFMELELPHGAAKTSPKTSFLCRDSKRPTVA
jgi:hypothetical protein